TCDLFSLGLAELAARDGDVDRVLLARVAHVGAPLERESLAFDGILREGRTQPLLELAPDAGQLSEAGISLPCEARLHDVVPQIAHQHPPRGEVAGSGRDDHPRNLQL